MTAVCVFLIPLKTLKAGDMVLVQQLPDRQGESVPTVRIQAWHPSQDDLIAADWDTFYWPDVSESGSALRN
jgi:hypothetical protein